MILGKDNQKMSKSKGNIVNPNDIIDQFGADTLRLYEMFMGPLVETKPWNDKNLLATRKWLERIWRLFEKFINSEIKLNKEVQNKELDSIYHITIKDVTQCIEDLKFNIAISKMMVYINFLYKLSEVNDIKYFTNFLIILSPFAPHIAEELMEKMQQKTLENYKWPIWNEKEIIVTNVTMSIQVNGKLRATMELELNYDDNEAISMAKKITNVDKYISGKNIIKVIHVKNKIINFVVN